MANRSSGAFTRTIWKDFAIVLRIESGESAGCSYETVKSAPDSRMALGMAFRDLRGDKGRIEMCKTADQMTADERCRYDMQTTADRIKEMREQDQRHADFRLVADMF